MLDVEDPTSALVFARTRGEVEELAERLGGRGHDAAALHGGMDQAQRDRIMTRFREGDLDVLVATDVAARGLDIEHVSHVVNYDVPSNPDAYVHRIGRTGRAGREGMAITLVEPRESRLLKNIERTIKIRLELAQVPDGADLRERRLELLSASLREQMLEDGIDRYRAVVESLAEEFDVLDVALAAVSLADQLERARWGRRRRDSDALALPERTNAPRTTSWAKATGGKGGPSKRHINEPWVRLFVGGGRRVGMRPADLVGAITNEASVTGASIGAIQIADSYSLVEVPESAADGIARVLGSGQDQGQAPGGPPLPRALGQRPALEDDLGVGRIHWIAVRVGIPCHEIATRDSAHDLVGSSDDPGKRGASAFSIARGQFVVERQRGTPQRQVSNFAQQAAAVGATD